MRAMYRKVQAHASCCSRSRVAGGSIRQSFCAALQAELAEFYHLMAVLQEQSLKEGPKADTIMAGADMSDTAYDMTMRST